MPFKATVKCHSTPGRMANVKKYKIQQSAGENSKEKKEPLQVMFVSLYVCVSMHACACMWRPEASLFSETESLPWIWSLQIKLGWVTSEPQGSLSLCPSGWDYKYTLAGFLCGSWESNSGPHACTTNTLPNELGLSSPNNIFFKKKKNNEYQKG